VVRCVAANARIKDGRLSFYALSNLTEWESHDDHKRTQQEVPNILLPYLYYRYMVYTSDK